MRIALLVVAGLALIGFLAVAVVLPQRAGAEAREAAQVLILLNAREANTPRRVAGRGRH